MRIFQGLQGNLIAFGRHEKGKVKTASTSTSRKKSLIRKQLNTKRIQTNDVRLPIFYHKSWTQVLDKQGLFDEQPVLD